MNCTVDRYHSLLWSAITTDYSSKRSYRCCTTSISCLQCQLLINIISVGFSLIKTYSHALPADRLYRYSCDAGVDII